MKTLILFAILAVLGGNPAKFLQNKQQEKTIETLTDLDGGHYYKMDYKADYKLQEFIEGDYNSQGAVRGAVASKLMNIPEAPKPGAENPACSAFQAVTPDGDIIVGRNFDYRFVDGSTVMLRTRPKKGYKSISNVTFNFVGLDGAQLIDGKTDLSILVGAPYMQMDGMNQKGFSVSVLAIVHEDCAKQMEQGKHTVMTSVMMRMLLDRAATVDEAIELLKDVNFFADGFQKDRKKGNFSNYHFMLADATGKAVVLEYVKEGGPHSDTKWVMNVIETKYVTNHFLTPGWAKPSNVDDRFKKLDAKLSSSNGVLTEMEAMQLLDDVHQTATKGHQGKTQWSVVYNLTKGTAKVCINHDYSKVFEFSLKRFNKTRIVER